MVQHEVNRALDDLEYVKKRIQSISAKQPAATRQMYLEFIPIINAAMCAAHACGVDPTTLKFPTDNYTKK